MDTLAAVGDGAYMMSSQAIETAMREKIRQRNVCSSY
jgi:thiamine pyrophosphate-dependent acetolactate synthase large subunit-like protein